MLADLRLHQHYHNRGLRQTIGSTVTAFAYDAALL